MTRFHSAKTTIVSEKPTLMWITVTPYTYKERRGNEKHWQSTCYALCALIPLSYLILTNNLPERCQQLIS